MRLLVCGGRYYGDRVRLYQMLDKIHKKHRISCIIEGACPYGGADEIASDWAVNNAVPNARFPMVGRAGPARNQKMLDEGKPTHCLAAPGGRGTADMVRRAIAAGLPVHVMSPTT